MIKILIDSNYSDDNGYDTFTTKAEIGIKEGSYLEDYLDAFKQALLIESFTPESVNTIQIVEEEISEQDEREINKLKNYKIGHPKYKVGDEVTFKIGGEEATGVIEIVDAYGTFEQNEEPSYDIMVEDWKGSDEKTLVKHVRESYIQYCFCE